MKVSAFLWKVFGTAVVLIVAGIAGGGLMEHLGNPQLLRSLKGPLTFIAVVGAFSFVGAIIANIWES